MGWWDCLGGWEKVLTFCVFICVPTGVGGGEEEGERGGVPFAALHEHLLSFVGWD